MIAHSQKDGEHAGVSFPTSVALNKMCGRVAPLPGGRSDRLLLPGDLVKVRYLGLGSVQRLGGLGVTQHALAFGVWGAGVQGRRG